MRDGDTIVALSSGALPSGVAVIRLSGPKSGLLLHALTGGSPEPRKLTLATIRGDAGPIDQGLLAWFPGPASFTGEDCAELQVHGSPAVVRALLRQATAVEAVRLAQAGEFTRRAFENGRLDLTEVEGLGDLILAETENQRVQAMARFAGGISRQIDGWRDVLLDARAEIEARLDFADEGDVESDVPPRVLKAIDGLRKDFAAALGSIERGRLVREGMRVALAGPPNAGKSSLLNALVRSEVAIVTDEPGTTRDVREVPLDLGGQLVTLIDMAGLRETDSKAEAEGVRRALEQIESADLILWLVAPDLPDTFPPSHLGAPVWTVGTKSDLRLGRPATDLSLSAKSGDGVQDLIGRLEVFAAGLQRSGEPALLSRERDRVAIAEAMSALGDAAEHFGRLEFAAEDLRRSSDALQRLTGAIDAEAVLDRLFSAFCIGK
jgi:tRNA modification GTPase